ncbi:C6 zinc finger domain protein [Aspergillus novofumigatus IBT 16806]|uniref:C6 zinc finger domain protein n=1 Tax=Aspergillus novofumigatus (strain IBT 16806) TaxID=1392255 RepID=A0A2I1C8J8_ASPN1|nr:C6 zinc finger domain protein [Aspergillus novofumigatus IBT 16806]PKX93962.1 C6 zinc finger domain protein [Aspergillus novofumigatus IBT 16806]
MECQQHPQPQPQRPQRRRRRPALSCRECRRRKIKCDHNNPCVHCLRHKTRCIYKPYTDGLDDRPITGTNQQHEHDFPASSPLRQTASPPPSDSSAPRQLAQAGDRDSDNINGSIPVPLQGSNSSTPCVTAPAAATAAQKVAIPARDLRQPHPDQGPDEEATFRDLLFRIQRLEESSAGGSRISDSPLHRANGRSEASAVSLASRSPAGSQEWQAVLNKSRDWGRSRWMGGANEFTAIIACYSQIMGKSSKDGLFQGPETSALISQATDFLQKCKNRARIIKTGRPTRGLLYRILHVPTFWVEYQRYWDNPDGVAPSLRLKVLLAIGIGSSLYDHGHRAAALRNIDLVQQWIYAAQTWLSGPLEKDRLEISGLQIYCLSILARQIFSIGGDTIWISIGSLIHSAMQLGLHRDPKHLPAISVLQAELRRRLWYTILEFNVQSSLDSWMPPRISFDEFDTEPPSNINDDVLDELTTKFQSCPKGTLTATSVQLALIDTLSVRLQIVQLLNGLHSELSYDRVLSLSSDLIDALQACSRWVKDGDGSTPFQRNLLDYLIRRFMIPLHYSFSNQACTNPLFHYSLKLSLDAALAMVSPEPDHSFARLMATGGGPSGRAISLELLAHVETQRLNGTLHRTRQYRDFLKQAVHDLISLSEERIRQGETNVKNHTFLSMILAQAEALRVVRAARDSLELCNTLLKTREDTGSMPSPDDAGLAAGMEGVQEVAFEGFGPVFGWESFFPDAGLGHSWGFGNLDS